MWRPGPELKLFKNRAGDDFARSTMIGWDECIPTIAPCAWNGRDLPDHGEAWSAKWEVDEPAFASGRLRTTMDLPVSRLRFARTLGLVKNQIIATYALTNLANEPQEFVWAMHPLLEICPEDRLELTEETRKSLGDEPWLRSLDLQDREPRFVKTFAGPLREGTAGIFNSRTKDRLTIHWQTAQNPFLGIWLTRGGWNGYHHLALEPTNARSDSLAEAVNETKAFGALAPNETREWSVSIVLDPAHPSDQL
jgi:hypothetical protein